MSLRSRRSLALSTLASAAVLAGGVVPLSAVHDAVSGKSPDGAELALPGLYVVISPLSRLFDTIGLLSTGEHVAVGATVVGVTLLLSGWRARTGRIRKRHIPVAAAKSFGVLVVAYCCAAALPGPMAMLSVADPDLVRVDVHSHTNASKDARRGFSVDDNRAWHRAAGFDVAYISDHRSFNGAETAVKGNPARAGDGPVLLSAFEGRYLGTFEVFLSLTRADSALIMDEHRHLLEGNLRSGRLPASVVALPSPLTDVRAEGRDGPPHIVAIEIVDGGPRGFAQRDQEGEEIVRRAISLGIALVAGSNNHGWGRVAPGWTLVRVPGWRELSPDSLGAAIESAIRVEPLSAVQAIERRRPSLVSPAALALTIPVAVAQALRALTLPERLVWLVWIWGAWWIGYLRLRRAERIREASENSTLFS